MTFIAPDDRNPFGEEPEKSMAESVTRHALIPFEHGFRNLSCGLDSLDLGLFVEFGSKWPLLREGLQNFKEQSQEKKGLPDKTPQGRTFLHLPTGKAPNYRFHLQFPDYHLYIAITHPPRKSPNVYVSLSAEILWQLGVEKSIQIVRDDLRQFGGEIHRILPSRADLCADYLIPGGISLDWLQKHKVARSRKHSHHGEGNELETFYVGSPGSPLRLRIYNKGKEVTKKGDKLWFLAIWNLDDAKDVWRVEFQVRRPILKQFKVDSLADLQANLGGLWHYLTTDWFSLRLLDDEKQDRRTVHPWWVDIQALADLFGPSINIQRTLSSDLLASAEWFISHISGCLPSFAARLGIKDINEAINRLNNEVCLYWFEKDFTGELAKRAVKIGKEPEAFGGDDEAA